MPIVLLAAAGVQNAEIARRMGTCDDTARKWRRRYCQQGMEGLADARRPGRPRVYPAATVAQVKTLAYLNRLLARIHKHDRYWPLPMAA